MGRYHYWRLHPLTLDDYPASLSITEALQRLLHFGGFPEPFLQADEREARRWRRERFDRVLREDIRDIDNIRNIDLLYLFVDSLRQRVGGLITLANLAQDLDISPKTAKSWLSLLENMYLGFTITPLTRHIPRSIKKPPKFYFFDNADVLNDQGARWENMIATTLLKRLHFIEDYTGSRCQLHYIRDKEGREVDFAVTIDGQLEEMIEVKSSDTSPPKALQYYTEKLRPKRAIQLVKNLKTPLQKNNILLCNLHDYLTKVNPAPWQQGSA